MRILSVRWEPVARVLAIIYGVLGATIFSVAEISHAPHLTLPLGVIAPVFDFSFKLNIPRPDGVFSAFGAGIAEILAYAVTGWITGAAAALCFNVVCKQLGGIDAKFVLIANEKDPSSDSASENLT